MSPQDARARRFTLEVADTRARYPATAEYVSIVADRFRKRSAHFEPCLARAQPNHRPKLWLGGRPG
jgi:hypothetical protein